MTGSGKKPTSSSTSAQKGGLRWLGSRPTSELRRITFDTPSSPATTPSMSSWDERFMEMAHLVASWSKDPSTKVGAVITDPESNRVVSVGFNGLPRFIPDDDFFLHDREIKNAMVQHAEQNALMFANGSLAFCTIYVTHPPCSHCAGMIIQAGIFRVVCKSNEKLENDPVWAKRIELAKEMFEIAGVDFERYK